MARTEKSLLNSATRDLRKEIVYCSARTCAFKVKTTGAKRTSQPQTANTTTVWAALNATFWTFRDWQQSGATFTVVRLICERRGTGILFTYQAYCDGYRLEKIAQFRPACYYRRCSFAAPVHVGSSSDVATVRNAQTRASRPFQFFPASSASLSVQQPRFFFISFLYTKRTDHSYN